MDLIPGAGKIDRRIAGAESILRDWREKAHQGELHGPLGAPPAPTASSISFIPRNQ